MASYEMESGFADLLTEVKMTTDKTDDARNYSPKKCIGTARDAGAELARCTRDQGECPHCHDPEMFGPCESDLTKRAREVLAGLGKAQRADVVSLSERGGWQPARTGYRLYELGVCERSSTRYRLADLGREIARLIAAANAEVGNG